MKQIESKNYLEYIDSLSEELKEPYRKTYQAIQQNIDPDIIEIIQYGMPSFVVPFDVYPDGYQSKPKTELPLISLAANKNSISLHSLALYADGDLHNWLIEEYIKRIGKKPDLGKGCLRLKKLNEIPFDLIAELSKKLTVKQWIALYESKIKRK